MASSEEAEVGINRRRLKLCVHWAHKEVAEVIIITQDFGLENDKILKESNNYYKLSLAYRAYLK